MKECRYIGKLRDSCRDRAKSSTFTFYDICQALRFCFGLSRGGEVKKIRRRRRRVWKSLKPNHPSVPTQIFLLGRFLPLYLSDIPYIICVIYVPWKKSYEMLITEIKTRRCAFSKSARVSLYSLKGTRCCQRKYLIFPSSFRIYCDECIHLENVKNLCFLFLPK